MRHYSPREIAEIIGLIALLIVACIGWWLFVRHLLIYFIVFIAAIIILASIAGVGSERKPRRFGQLF